MAQPRLTFHLGCSQDPALDLLNTVVSAKVDGNIKLTVNKNELTDN